MIKTPELTGNRIKEYLEQGKRFDGRKPEDFREIIIETGVSQKAEGSARVKIGKTEVLVGIKMDTGTPYPDSPDKGNMMVTAELLPLSSPRFEYGPPRFPAIELGRLTDRAIRESKFIELDKLCIEKGEKVWTVFIDVYTINDDGNLLDAAGIAAIAALKDAKIPKYDEKEEKVLYGELTNKALPLAKILPVTVTAHKIGNNFVVDPTREEEDVSESMMTVGATAEGIISSMQKGKSKALKIEDFTTLLNLTEKARKQVFSALEKSKK